jgi:hypothetical protein
LVIIPYKIAEASSYKDTVGGIINKTYTFLSRGCDAQLVGATAHPIDMATAVRPVRLAISGPVAIVPDTEATEVKPMDGEDDAEANEAPGSVVLGLAGKEGKVGVVRRSPK